MDFIFDAQMSIGDMNALENFARTIQPYRTIEVGSWKGLSTSILARFSQKVYCVDTWKAAPSTPSMELEARQADIFTIFRHNMRAKNVEDKICAMVMTSIEAAAVIRDGSADLVFIDADHAYSSICQDIRAWYPKVKAGGILCGHDLEAKWSDLTADQRTRVIALKESDFMRDELGLGRGIHPGVTKAIHDIFDDKVEILPGSSIWWKRL